MSTRLIRLTLILQMALLATLLCLIAAGPAPVRAHPISYLFLSANTDESLTLADAQERLATPAHRQSHELVGDILHQVGIKAHKRHDAVGDWSDGVENSVLVTIHAPVDPRTLEYAAGCFGLLARQKAVLAFHAGDGPDTVIAFDVEEALPLFRAKLDRIGIRERTLVRVAKGHRIIVFDQGSRRLALLNRLAGQHGAHLQVATGTGLFVGASSRREAQAAYHDVIHRYEKNVGNRRYRPTSSASVIHQRPECVSTLWISIKPRTETPDEPGPIRTPVPARRGVGRCSLRGTGP